MSYRLLEHTADLALEARADRLNELFAEALRGLTDCLTPVEGVEPIEERSLELEAVDLEQLLVEWLGEAVYLFEVDEMVFSRARVEVSKVAGGWRIRASASGERFDPGRHRLKVPIKGVTYHRLEVRRDGESWRARVVLDI